MTANKLYCAEGTIHVTPQRYWFSSGGEKGPFGYYPHLKDQDGYPVFPDTQIYGDLRMAAEWIAQLDKATSPKLIDKLFGKKIGGDSSAMLYLSDLGLTTNSKSNWDGFVIKPRIEINDSTRTVKDKMLVYFELAYFENCELEARIFLGYFADQQELQDCCDLLENSLRFLSGFGAFRSRGYGRVKTSKIDWKHEEIAYDSNALASSASGPYHYFLKSLVHFRNKEIRHERSQSVRTQKIITARQMESWFAVTYHRIFNDWPSASEMEQLKFSDFYLAFVDGYKKQLGLQPPITTVKFEDGTIKDICQSVADNGADHSDDENRQENFCHQKSRPLGDSVVVTDAATPLVQEVMVVRRVCNAMGDNFTTKKEGGLFVQEYIPAGITWGGKVNLAATEFSKRADFILRKIRPTIKGTVFEPEMLVTSVNLPVTQVGKQLWLVVNDIPIYSNVFSQPNNLPEDTQITLKNNSFFNTGWKRPYRNQITIGAGSLIAQNTDGNCLVWRELHYALHPISPKTGEMHLQENKQLDIKLSRSQAGILREFCNPQRKPDELRKIVVNLQNKYKRWVDEAIRDKLIPKDVLDEIQDFLAKSQTKEMRKYITTILASVQLKWWEDKRPDVREKFNQQEAKNGD